MSDLDEPRAANDPTKQDPYEAAARHANELERQLAEARRTGRLVASALEWLDQRNHDGGERIRAALAEARKLGWVT